MNRKTAIRMDLSAEQKHQFRLICICNFLLFASLFLIITHLPEFLKELGNNNKYIEGGYAIFFFSITAGITRPFTGFLTDKYGQKKVMLLGALISLVCSSLYLFMHLNKSLSLIVYLFLFTRIIHGLTLVFQPTSTAFVVEIIPEKSRGKYLSILSMSGSIAIGFCPFISDLIKGQKNNLNLLFLISALLAGLVLFILFFFVNVTEDKAIVNIHKKRNFTINNLYEKSVFNPSLITFLISLIYGSIIILSLKIDSNLNLIVKGQFFIIFTIVSLIIRLVSGKYFDKYGRHFLLLLASFFTALTMLIFASSTNSYTFFIFAAISYGFSRCIFTPISFAWATDLSNSENRNRAMSSLTVSTELGIGLGAILSSYLYDNFFEFKNYTFGVLMVFPILAFIYIFILMRKEGSIYKKNT